MEYLKKNGEKESYSEYGMYHAYKLKIAPDNTILISSSETKQYTIDEVYKLCLCANFETNAFQHITIKSFKEWVEESLV